MHVFLLEVWWQHRWAQQRQQCQEELLPVKHSKRIMALAPSWFSTFYRRLRTRTCCSARKFTARNTCVWPSSHPSRRRLAVTARSHKRQSLARLCGQPWRLPRKLCYDQASGYSKRYGSLWITHRWPSNAPGWFVEGLRFGAATLLVKLLCRCCCLLVAREYCRLYAAFG